MSYEVDVGWLNGFTLLVGWKVGLWNEGPFGEFAAGQWYRAAPEMLGDNSPGASFLITSEGIFRDDSGSDNLFMELANNGNSTVAIGVNWLSAPSKQ
jgi:hypothetical protein